MRAETSYSILLLSQKLGNSFMATAALLSAALAVAVVAAAALDTTPVPFDAGFVPLYGNADHLVLSPDGRSIQLKLDRSSGSGFVSKSAYHHGFFSASIKLPAGYTAGVVVAFYLSNGDEYQDNHDELDMELLGNRGGYDWGVQTNMYGNGSTARGWEERYRFPFDPTAAAHRYAVAWTPGGVVFYLDGVPVREVVHVPAMAGDFPSKPMSVYATIWDGSDWATDGGKYKVDYAYAPFVAEFSGLVLQGCDAGGECPAAADLGLTPADRAAMRAFRDRYMTYTVCRDKVRYKNAVLPECAANPGAAADGSELHVRAEPAKPPRRLSKASPPLHSSSTTPPCTF